MKKVLAISLAVILLAALCAVPVMAAPAGKDIPANKNMQNVYLYPKEPPPLPGAPEWVIQWDEPDWGKFNFRINGQMISGVFNGHGLVADTDYTLISYNDPWGTPHKVIASGTADAEGNVHIGVRAVDLGTDNASPIYDWSGVGDGYKIWLVPTADITISGDTCSFDGWNPDAILFEHHRIGATATAPAP